MATINKDLGMVTAYAYAVSKGYTGTEEEFAQYIANVGQNAQAAAESAESAARSATTAGQSAESAAQSALEVSRAVEDVEAAATAAEESEAAASDSADDAQADALKAEGFAVGKQDGVDVDAQSEYYQNNSKYYKDQAKSIYDDAVGVRDSIPADYSKLSQDVTDLKADLNSYSDGIELYKNIVSGVVAGYVPIPASGSGIINITQDANRGYVVIPVVGGETYAVNTTSFSANFSMWSYEQNGIDYLISRISPIPADGVLTAPPNADKLYLSNANWNSNTDIVIVHSSDSIIGYSKSDYPFQTLKGVCIPLLYEPDTQKHLSESLEEIRASIHKPPFDNTFSYQYIDNTKWTAGKRWHHPSSGGIVEWTAEGYSMYPAVHLKAGTYRFNGISKNFSFFMVGDTVTALNQIITDDVFTLPEDADLYFSTNTGTEYSMVSTGDFNYVNLQIQYVLGQYNPTINHVFYVGSKRNIKTLREALAKATEFFDSIVFVDAEDFDLVSEFGQEYLDNYDGSERMIGLFLKNRVHIIFASGARVLFNYTGGNQNVHDYFSPFNAGQHGFTIENAWVESFNCRYTVHDELDSSKIPYHNIYKRCTFIHDSRNTSFGANRAIGGGLGLHGDILIEDCVALSVGADENMPVISYHNATSQTEESKSNIVVRGCYLGTTFRCTNQGLSQNKSRAIVTNCSAIRAPYADITITAERADNMEIYEWNNVIRS